MLKMLKTSFFAALAVLGAMSAGSAVAGNVRWSVNVDLPPAVVVAQGGGYYREPVGYYQPAPVYQQPAPVYYQPQPVVMQRQPVVVYPPQPMRVGAFGLPVPPHHRWLERHVLHRHHDHGDWGRDERRDEYGDRRGGDRWDDGYHRGHR